MSMVPFVVIDTRSNQVTRFEGRQPTHQAWAATAITARLIEDFRTKPDDEFRIFPFKPEAA